MPKKNHLNKARREVRRIKHEARTKHAVSIIWASWQGAKVLIMCMRLLSVISFISFQHCTEVERTVSLSALESIPLHFMQAKSIVSKLTFT